MKLNNNKGMEMNGMEWNVSKGNELNGNECKIYLNL